MNNNTSESQEKKIEDQKFREKFEKYLWGEDRFVFRETVCYFDLWEESVDDVIKRLEEDRKGFRYTKRQFVQTCFLPFECRRLYLETFADSLDELDTNADPNIPYPDNAEDLERLRLHTGVSRRWWAETHLDDYQKKIYLEKYCREIEHEEPSIKYGTTDIAYSKEEFLQEEKEINEIKQRIAKNDGDFIPDNLE